MAGLERPYSVLDGVDLETSDLQSFASLKAFISG